ncbi:MAG TPA: hypothetical protein VFO51_08910 [Sphingomicrobium sp.]|nr:hypothetical protein [Sphingomicrobium sp.]
MKTGAAIAAALLAGCGGSEPTVIDGSSPQAFERTAAQARREIPDSDRLVFDRALRTVGGRQHSARDPDALARVTFDGMTAEQIVADQKAREGLGDR